MADPAKNMVWNTNLTLQDTCTTRELFFNKTMEK